MDENKSTKDFIADGNANSTTLVALLKKVVDDLDQLRQLQKIDDKRSNSDWLKLADRLETFFLIFFVYANAFVTVVFIAVGQAHQMH